MHKMQISGFFGICLMVVLLAHLLNKSPDIARLKPVEYDRADGTYLTTEHHKLPQLERLLAEWSGRHTQASRWEIDAQGSARGIGAQTAGSEIDALADARDISRYHDLGTRLDNLFRDDALHAESDWAAIDEKLTLSFPGRDIRGFLGILSCHRDYRVQLQKIQDAAINPAISENAIQTLRQKVFGQTLVNSLYATEYQLLASLDEGGAPLTIESNVGGTAPCFVDAQP